MITYRSDILKQVKLNSHNTNAAIQAHILDDGHMRKIGFRDYDSDIWYYWCFMPKPYDISFNVTIPKDGSDISIDILNENFGQLWDAQYILFKNPNNKYAKNIMDFVYNQMEHLINSGILSNWKYGDYI